MWTKFGDPSFIAFLSCATESQTNALGVNNNVALYYLLNEKSQLSLGKTRYIQSVLLLLQCRP